MSEDDQEVSRRYWKAAISALPTAEKRDAAWEFYLDKFTGTNAGDTLSGLILLLEANGAFLLTLPAKFHEDMTLPIIERLSAMREELQANVEGQRAALRAADAVNEGLDKANKQFAATTALFAFKVRAAAAQIDTGALANQVYCSLHSSIAIPLRNELRALPEQSKRLDEASKAAESSIEKWRRVHLGGIILNASIAALLVASLLFCFAWFRLQRHFNEQLAAEIAQISGNHETLKETALLNIPVHLTPWSDQDGKPVPGGYAFSIDHAEDAAVQTTDSGKRGVIFFKGQRPEDQIEELRGLLNDIQKAKDH